MVYGDCKDRSTFHDDIYEMGYVIKADINTCFGGQLGGYAPKGTNPAVDILVGSREMHSQQEYLVLQLTQATRNGVNANTVSIWVVSLAQSAEALELLSRRGHRN